MDLMLISLKHSVYYTDIVFLVVREVGTERPPGTGGVQF